MKQRPPPPARRPARPWLRRRALRAAALRSEEHTSELQSLRHLVCRLLLEKKKPPASLQTSRTSWDAAAAPIVGRVTPAAQSEPAALAQAEARPASVRSRQ